MTGEIDPGSPRAYDRKGHLIERIGIPVTVATFTAAQALRVLPRVKLSRAVGRLCGLSLSPRVSRLAERVYVRAYRVNMAEAEPYDGPYPCFDAFFTRALRRGTRPIEEGPVVSPADGAVHAIGPIDEQSRILVKGRPYAVAELVGEPRDAKRYAGGSFAVVYLSPRDYHRVHSPVDGSISVVRGMPGDLYPVNAIGERHVPRLLVRNNRVAICIDTQQLGRATVVMVGAVVVGRISVNVLPNVHDPEGVYPMNPSVYVRRGDEIGTFHLGSTAVLLLEPGAEIAHPLGPVRYGQSLAKGP